MPAILFVDDDHEMRQALGTYLSWYGHQVDYAGTFEEALESLQKKAYALLISEAALPASPAGGPAGPRWKNGFEFSQYLRSKEDMNRIRILLIGCEELEPEEYRTLKKGDIFYMNKYKTIEAWLEKIEALLQKEPV